MLLSVGVSTKDHGSFAEIIKGEKEKSLNFLWFFEAADPSAFAVRLVVALAFSATKSEALTLSTDAKTWGDIS